MNGTITGMISDYTGHMTTTPVATTPAEIFAMQQQHAAQLGLGNYNLVNSLGSNHQLIDEDDDDNGLMNDDVNDNNDMLEKIDDDDDDDQNHLIAGDIVDLQQIQLQQQYQQYGYAQDSLLGTTQDDNSGDYDNGNSEYLLSPINSYMTAEIPHQRILASKSTTIATQTSHHQQIGGKEHYRKIKPVKRPGLVLKTPIAYQGNIDPSVIPIQRDGMGKVFVLFIHLYHIFFIFIVSVTLLIDFLFYSIISYGFFFSLKYSQENGRKKIVSRAEMISLSNLQSS
jgi:hypothetical protein